MDPVMKLLSEGKRGKMTRRQLLAALGASATGAFAMGVLPRVTQVLAAQAAGAGKSFPVTTMNHLSFSVPVDYKKSRDWYIDLLEMNCVWDDGTKCELDFGNPVNGIYMTQ